MSDDAYRVDFHVKILDHRVVSRAKRAGLDAIVYAPHFTRLPDARSRASLYADDELAVIPAREVFTGTWRDRAHVLAFDLEEPIPDFITLDGAMAELERQDAVAFAPHPEFATVSLDEVQLRTYRDQFDAVEVFNPKHLPAHNRRAAGLAETLELPPFTSSYAHLGGTVGIAFTEFDGVGTVDELFEAIRAGEGRRVVYRNGLERLGKSAAEMAHLFWENSWQKIDRLFLSGTEPTNPRHVAYDGAFDDVAVY